MPISRATLDRYYPPDRRVAARLYGMIRAQLPPDAIVLDLGAGGSVAPDRSLKPHAAKVCGVDVDPIVLNNPDVHEARLLHDDGTIPYPDATFHAALSDYVFEHLPDPALTLREVHRVLRPGGRYYFRTINRWHYLSVISRLMPRRLATKLADVLGHQPQDAAKTHATYFRLNAPGQIRRAAAAAGFEVEQLTTLETHPVYFQRIPPLWHAMVGVERLMNKLPLFAPMRMALYGALKKPITHPPKPHAEPPEGGQAPNHPSKPNAERSEASDPSPHLSKEPA